MQAPNRKAVMGFAFEMARHAPKSTLWHVERLLRYGRTQGQFWEDFSNGPQVQQMHYESDDAFARRYKETHDRWQNVEMPKREMKMQKTRKRIVELLTEIDCRSVFSSDPRGNTVKVIPPDGYTNDWGHEGICVPTS